MIANIPTTIITGFLGVGKTTALNHLIAQKPDGEVWAIVVNEFGQVGIDQTAIETVNGIQVKELTGGCVCCALGPALSVNLVQLIRKTKPHRVIIEPTGLGHPAGIMDILQSPSFKEVLDVRSVICLVDPRVVDQPATLQHPTFIDQLNLADIIVLNKCDLATQNQIDEAYDLSTHMFPSKQLVYKTEQGRFPLNFIDALHLDKQAEVGSHASSNIKATTAPLAQLYLAQSGQPVRLEHTNSEGSSCGWIFHCNDQFDHDKLNQLLTEIDPIWRLKGVFRLGNTWVFYNRIQNDMNIQPISWRRDSRIEIISEKPLDWADIELKLIGCIKNKELQHTQ